jgi:hypothetical protein
MEDPFEAMVNRTLHDSTLAMVRIDLRVVREAAADYARGRLVPVAGGIRMAKLREIGSAFLDGLGSLAFLFERPVRPGSNEDLIDSPRISENVVDQSGSLIHHETHGRFGRTTGTSN